MKIVIDLGVDALATMPSSIGDADAMRGILQTAIMERLGAIERRVQAHERGVGLDRMLPETLSAYNESYQVLNGIHKRLRAYPEAVTVVR